MENIISTTVLPRAAFAAELIARGRSVRYTVKQVMSHFNVSNPTAYRDIKNAYTLLKYDNDEYLNNIRSITINRLEELLDDCTTENDRKTKLETIREIAKVSGIYNEDVKVDVGNIVFKFNTPENHE